MWFVDLKQAEREEAKDARSRLVTAIWNHRPDAELVALAKEAEVDAAEAETIQQQIDEVRRLAELAENYYHAKSTHEAAQKAATKAEARARDLDEQARQIRAQNQHLLTESRDQFHASDNAVVELATDPEKAALLALATNGRQPAAVRDRLAAWSAEERDKAEAHRVASLPYRQRALREKAKGLRERAEEIRPVSTRQVGAIAECQRLLAEADRLEKEADALR